MKKIVCFLVAFLVVYGHAQEKTKEDLEREKRLQDMASKVGQDTGKTYGWKHSVQTGLNMTQVSFTDWAPGGDNALSYTVWLRGSSIQDMETTNWTNGYRLAFGQSRLGSQSLRKTDDEMYVESILIYKLGLFINPYAAATLRSQFAKGVMYDNQGNETEVSKFFDPGYLVQSIGVAFKPVPEFTTRFGVAAREIITSTFTQYADDPATPEIEKTKVQGGLESVSDVEWNFAENMIFASHLELFDAFKTLDKVIVRSDNAVMAKVNKYVTVGLTLQLVNDVDSSPRTQIKEVLALGVSYALL
jgi:hypothetical protein